MSVRRLTFVVSTRANLFMAEILEALAGAVRSLGVEADVAADAFPPLEDGRAYAVVPHEFFATTPPERLPADEQLRRTIAIGTEQPGSPWFAQALGHGRRCAAVVDISPVGVTEWRRQGVDADVLPLGYTPDWDVWHGDADAERPIDVLFLGSLNRRRDLLLCEYAKVLWRHRCELVITTHEPKVAPGPDYHTGADKHGLLARAKVLLCPGRQEDPYFEWVRAIEAMSNGCVVVCDHAAGAAPLVAGTHFISGRAENLALLADGLLRDPEWLGSVRTAAYETLRAERTMRAGAERLIALASDVLARPAFEVPRLPPAPPPPPEPPAPDPARAALKRSALEGIDLRRRVATLEARAAGEAPGPRLVHRTPAWDGAAPRVSVCIPCFNYEREVVEAIASVAAQDFEALELLVVDDASEDGSVAAVRAALEERPWLPATLLARRVNGGLARARNVLAEQARGEYVLMLDADNTLYPPAVTRLVEALDGDPGALFAYPVLEGHEDGAPAGLLSYRAWDPALLRERNIVDALALLRRDRLLALGGYLDDLRMFGWEDYDLYARAAERGERGIRVPEILGRYRRGHSSMLSITDLDTSVMERLLQERYPRTMGPLQDR